MSIEPKTSRREEVLKLMEEEGSLHQWTHKESNYPCVISRSPTTGAWCGYVQLPGDHPFAELSYDDIEGMDDVEINVHGGLTFSENRMFGFDCSHAFDYYPMMNLLGGFNQFVTDFIDHHERSMGNRYEVIYRTKEYAISETNKLAEQFFKYKDKVVKK